MSVKCREWKFRWAFCSTTAVPIWWLWDSTCFATNCRDCPPKADSHNDPKALQENLVSNPSDSTKWTVLPSMQSAIILIQDWSYPRVRKKMVGNHRFHPLKTWWFTRKFQKHLLLAYCSRRSRVLHWPYRKSLTPARVEHNLFRRYVAQMEATKITDFSHFFA